MRSRRAIQSLFADTQLREKARDTMYEHVFGKDHKAWREVENNLYANNNFHRAGVANAIRAGLVNVIKGRAYYNPITECIDEIIACRDIKVELLKVVIGGYRQDPITCEFKLTDDAGNIYNSMLMFDDDNVRVNEGELISHFKNNMEVYMDQIVSYLGKKRRTFEGVRCVAAFKNRYRSNKYLDNIFVRTCMEHYGGNYMGESLSSILSKERITTALAAKFIKSPVPQTTFSTDNMDQELNGLVSNDFKDTFNSERAYECFKVKDTDKSPRAQEELISWVQRSYINAIDGEFYWANKKLIDAIEDRYQRMMDWYNNTKGSWKLSLFNLQSGTLDFVSEDSQGVNIRINQQTSSYSYERNENALIKMMKRTGLMKDLYREFRNYLSDAMICNLSEALLDSHINQENAMIPLRDFLAGLKDS